MTDSDKYQKLRSLILSMYEQANGKKPPHGDRSQIEAEETAKRVLGHLISEMKTLEQS